MADQTPPGHSPSQEFDDGWTVKKKPEKEEKAQRKPLYRRWWVLTPVIVLLALGLLVMLLPTLASTAMARSIILGKVNARLNGKVTVEDWSLGWGGGISVRGVRVFSAEGAQILEMKRFSTELTGWDVVKGNYYTLGKTSVEGLDFDLKQYNDGTTNFQRLAKAAPASPGTGRRQSKPAPFEMPPITGEFDVDLRGTVMNQQPDGQWQAVKVDRSTIKAKVPDINGPLQHEVHLTLRGESGSTGTISATGVADLFDKGVFDLNTFTAQEIVNIQSLENATLLAFMPAGGAINRLGGMTSGQLTVSKSLGGESVVADGTIRSEAFAIGGPALKGDTFATSMLEVKIPSTTFERFSGRLRTGGEGTATPLTISFDQGAVLVGADASIGSIIDVLSNRSPGNNGQLASVVKLDLSKLATQMPNLLSIDPKARLQSGTFEQTLSIRMEQGKAIVSERAKVSELHGTREGKPVSIRPIELALDVTRWPDSGSAALIPDLRDLTLRLDSVFATINGKADTIENLEIPGTIKLAEAQRELGQIIDFGQLKMGGLVNFQVRTKGDFTNPNSQPTVDATVTGRDVLLEGLMDAPIREPWLHSTVVGKLVQGQGNEPRIKAINDIIATLRTGNEQKPTIDLDVRGNALMAPMSAMFNVVRGHVDLPAAATEFAAILAPLTDPTRGAGLQFANGRLNISGRGAWTSAATSLDGLRVQTTDLHLRKQSHDVLRDVLRDYDGTIDVSGRIDTTDKGTQARLSNLAIQDQQKILTLRKSGDSPIDINLPRAGGFDARGKLEVGAALKPLQDILRALGQQPIQARQGETAGEVLAGQLDGVLDLQPAQNRRMGFDGTFNIKDLSIATANPEQPIRNETVTLSALGSADERFSDLRAQKVELKSAFANVLVADAALRLSGDKGQPVPPLEVVQRANMTLDIPSLSKLDALIMAFTPPTADPAPTQPNPPSMRPAPARPASPAPAGAIGRREAVPEEPEEEEAPAALPPIRWTSGSLNGSLAMDRQAAGLRVVVNKLDGKSIAFERGPGRMRDMDVDLKLTALIQPKPAAPDATFMQQIASLNLTDLGGKLGITYLDLVEPISMEQGADAKWTASGAIKARGELVRVSELLDALAARPFDRDNAYGGAFDATQRLATDRGVVKIKGAADVTNFVVGPADKPRFREQRVRLEDELDLDQARQDLLIRQLDLSMETTRALAASVRGRIAKYETEREFHGVNAGEPLTVGVEYDSEKVLELIRPMMTPEAREQLKSLFVKGVHKSTFAVTGKMPVEPEKDRKGKNVKPKPPLFFTNIEGSLVFDEIRYQGVPARNVEVPIYATQGILRTVYREKDGSFRRPAPATSDQGTINLGGFEVAYLNDPPLISHPDKNHKLIDGVAVPPMLVDNVGGSISPLFANTEDAKGRVSLTVVELKDFPLGEAMKRSRKGKRDAGIARVEFNAQDFAIKNVFGAALAKQLNLKVNPDGSLPLDIKNAQVGLTNGLVSSDINFPLLGHPMGTKGTVRLSDGGIVDMTLFVPKALIPSRDVQRFALLKERIEVPVTGNVRRFNMDILQAALRSIDPTNLIPGLLDGGRNPPRDRKPPPGSIGKE